jgi:hypothetical protein
MAVDVAPTFPGPTVVQGGLRREGDTAFSPQARRAIAAARHYLEQQRRCAVDAYYRVTHQSDHNEVYVQFVSGYRFGMPEFMPGNYCTVLVAEDGSVIRVLPGA